MLNNTRAEPVFREKFKAYAYWSAWVSIAFFTVYPLCAYVTAHRDFRLQLYAPAELDVPFVPESIWLYLSMYVLFLIIPFCTSLESIQTLGRSLIVGTMISGAFFLILPTEVGFQRLVPASGIYKELFATLVAVDLPHNMFPSLHVVYSGLILLAMVGDTNSIMVKYLYICWLILICTSTVLIRQHHMIDVIGGLALVGFLHFQKRSGPRSIIKRT